MSNTPREPTDPSKDEQPSLSRWTRRIVVLATVLLVASGVAPLILRAVDGPPALETGSVPDDYSLDVVADGDTVDLSAVGMARLGGTVDNDAARVIVEAQDQRADATIDRSVTPAVWWVNTAAPATGNYDFAVTAVGNNGQLRRSTMAVDFVFPEPDDTVTSPDALVLGEEGNPTLKSFDVETGEIELAGVKRGQVREGMFLVSDIDGAAPNGLLRRVDTPGSAAGDVKVATSQGRLDDVIYQAKFTGPGGGPGSVASPTKPLEQDFGVGVGIPKGTKPDKALAALRKSAKIKEPKKLEAPRKLELGKGLMVRFGVAAGIEAELDLELTYRKVWFFKIPSGLDHLNITVSANGTLVAELGGDGPTDPTKPDKSALAALLATKGKSFKAKKELFEYDMTPVSFMIGPIPVVINGSVEAEATADGEIVPSSVLAASTGFELGASARITPRSRKLEPIHNADFHPEYALGIAGNASIGVKLEPGIEVYGVLGAGVLMGASIDGTFSATVLDSTSDRGPGIDASLGLNLGVGAKAEVELFGLYEKELQTPMKTFPIYTCSLTFYPAEAPGSTDCSAFGDPDPSRGGGGSGGGGPNGAGEGAGGSSDALTSIIVMDTSSSMSETDGQGKVRIEGAREAIAAYLKKVDSNARVGLRTYPSDSDCGGGTLLIPPQRVDRGAINQTVAQLEPAGNTPTHIALEAALDDLPDSGFRTIILVSDGEGNCGGENGASCEVARQVAASGVELTFNTVGFQISDAGQQELQCIADATKGSYKTVEDGEALADELNALTEPRLTVTMDAPSEIQMDSTGAPTEPVEVTAVVNNVGGRDAKGVSLSLAQAGGTGVEIPDAGKLIGNIRAGERRSATWTVDPVAASEGFTSTWTAAAVAGGVEPSEDVAETSVVVPSTELGDEVGPVLKGAKRVAILGDGGVVGADSDSDCEPPTEIIGRLGDDDLFTDTQVLACAGASTVQIGSGSDSQLDELASMQSSTAFDAALISLGSTDVGLPSMLDRCAAGSCDVPAPECEGEECRPLDATDFEQRLVGLQRSALSVLAQTDAALGSRGAPIIVATYPKIFPDQGRSRETCLGEGTVGIEEFNSRTERLNDTLAEVARTAQDVGLPVRMMSSAETTLADTINDQGAKTPGRTACDRRALVTLGEDGEPPAPAPLEGYGGQLTRSLLADAGGWQAIQPAEHGSVAPTDTASASSPGGQVKPVGLDGFAPDANVEVTVGEPGVYIGTLRADDDGRVEGDLLIPEWAGNGDQQLRGMGVDPEGTGMVASTTVEVSDGPPWGWLRWLLPIVSLLLFGAAAWFALRSRPAKVHARAFDATTVAGA